MEPILTEDGLANIVNGLLLSGSVAYLIFWLIRRKTLNFEWAVPAWLAFVLVLQTSNDFLKPFVSDATNITISLITIAILVTGVILQMRHWRRLRRRASK